MAAMNDRNGNRATAIFGLLTASLIMPVACEPSRGSAGVEVVELESGHKSNREGDVLRCCERRVSYRRREECFFEALHDRGVCAPRPPVRPDAGAADAGRDVGSVSDASAGRDAGSVSDASAGRDAGSVSDASAGRDAGSVSDASAGRDAGSVSDASVDQDGGTATCGNNFVEPGEQCDPPRAGGDGLQCGPDCQFLTCGNGVLDPGEQCDPPRSTGSFNLCDQNCQIPTCGDGIVEPGESCDPPNTVVCDSQCQNIPIACGNGIIQPGETCDFPGFQFCQGCQITTCGKCFFASLGTEGVNPSNTDFVCQVLTGTARTTCQALLSCMSQGDAQCLFPPFFTGLTACYCSDATCSAGANGQCAAQFNAVAGTTDPAVVIGELSDPNSLLVNVRNEAVKFGNSSCGMACGR
jgi:hypothetical protein